MLRHYLQVLTELFSVLLPQQVRTHVMTTMCCPSCGLMVQFLDTEVSTTLLHAVNEIISVSQHPSNNLLTNSERHAKIWRLDVLLTRYSTTFSSETDFCPW